MRSKPLSVAALLFAAGLSQARADIASDYAALTAGLTSVPGSGGTPGSVVMHGRTAFPVLTANANGTAPVVAAGHWNDDTNSGRGLAYSHTGWTSTTGNMGLAMSNALRWAARAKPNAVIAKGAGVSTTFITSLGYTVKTVDTTMAGAGTDLTGVDVFLMNGQSDYAAGAVTKITNFVAAGGGVLVFSTPWAASDAALADANTVLCGVGLTFSGDYNSGGPFSVSATPYPNYVSALNGLDLLLAQRGGTTNVALSIQQAAVDGIDGVLAVRPLFPPLTNGLAQLLASYGGHISINSGRTLTKAAAPIEALCERYESGVFDLTPAAQLTKHPDADDWPGAVPMNAPVANKTVIVQGNAPPDDPALINQGSHGTRQPVGLYARAGTVMRVIIPADKTGAGLRIQIGIHYDQNFNLDSWHRHPKILRLEPLTNVVNEIGSPFGGLLFVRVPPGAALGNFPITIENAVEAPHFEQGVDAPGDWLARLRALPGAWGYIRTSNFTAYASRNALQGVADAGRVAAFWGNNIQTADYYLGYLNRFREEAAECDRDIAVGYGHAGYPVVMAYGDSDVLVNGVLRSGDWGFYHELGHTFQDDGHGWNGTSGAEVDVNLNPNLLMTLVHKRSLWDNNTHSTMDAANRAADRAAYFATANVWTDISGGGTSAPYDFYFNLVESFGYDLWHRAFSRFYRWSTNNASEPGFAGLDKYNRWFVAMCEETGCNLTPYFDNYRWPVDAPNKARFAGSPIWSSNRPPVSLNLPAPLTLGESTPAGTLVATFTTTDPDPGNLFLYSLLSGNEDGAFMIDRWSGELRVASLDYERRSSYALTVTVFDNALPRYFLTNTLAITVTNVGEAPVISAPLLVASNTMAVGTTLGTVTATADTGRTIALRALVSGAPVFAVNAGSGAVTLQQPGALPNPGVLTLLVSATDNLGISSTGAVQVACNLRPGLREQRWNGAAASGATTFDGVVTTWPSASIGDNYVRRLTAWLVPPQTGAFTFWVTGSDRATLYLGTNAGSSGRVDLCTGASTGVGNFDSDPGQRSAPVWLEAGSFHYLEVFQNEVTGTDYAQAAWQGPGVPARGLIPASVLIPGSDAYLPPGGGSGPVTGVALRFGPGDTTTYTAPANIPLNADLAGDAASATNVQFLVSGSPVAGDNTFPFSAAWNGAAAGSYMVQAVARDQFGNSVTSPARLVTVLKVEGAFTTPVFGVVITDPAPGATLVYPRPPTISMQPVVIQSVTPAGQITNLTLRADGVVVSQTNASAATLRWPVPDGNPHVLDAVARNSLGESVTSAPVMVHFRTNLPPRITFGFPAPFAVLPATNTFFPSVEATDPDGTVAEVEMLVDGVSLGVLDCPPYVWLWNGSPGSHTLSARARDNDGQLSFGFLSCAVTAPPLVTNLTFVSSNTTWNYNDEGVGIGSSWTNGGFNDSAWSNGVARLGFGGDGEITPLRGQPRITYYFRKTFLVPAGFAGTNLVVKLSRDDGAVVYLNGMEVVRDNMPAGAISYSTRPGAAVSAPNEQAYFTFITNAVALRPGTNVVAAEVHQIDGSSSDIGFDLELTATGLQTTVDTPPPLLNLDLLSPTQLRVSFADLDGLAYAIEGSTNLPAWISIATNIVSGGVFQHISSATNPPAQFFRVRRVP